MSARSKYWRLIEAIAWIAFRSHDAVDTAAQIGGRDPLRRLVAYAAAGRFRRCTDLPPAQAVVEAKTEVDAALSSGHLAPERESYLAADIKASWPTKEGRGKGQASRKELRPAKVRRLAWHLVTTPRTGNWLELFAWCKAEGITASKRTYEELRPAALRYAERELACRIATGVGVSNARAPLSAEEAAWCAENIRSWRRVGARKRKV